MKNNVKRNSIILLFITAIILIYILKDNFTETFAIIFKSNPLFLLASVLCYLIYVFIESLVLKTIVNQFNSQYSFKKSINLMIMTQFFNGITPFSGGGQPLQVYELSKEDVKPVDGTLVVVERFFVSQTAVITFTVLAIILTLLFPHLRLDKTLYFLADLGLILNVIVMLLIYFLCINKKMNKKIIGFIVKLLSKIKIVKHLDETINKWEIICNEYYDGYQELKKNKGVFKKSLCLHLLCLLFFFSTSFFVFKSFGINIAYLDALVISVLIFIVGSYVPIPGGSGGIEYAFIGFYNSFIDPSLVLSGLVLWRFIYYYFPVLIGGIIFNIRNFKMKVKGETK